MFLRIRPDGSQFAPETAKVVQTGVGDIAKKGAALLGGMFAGAGLISAARQGIEELKNSATAASNVDAVIKATGGSAHVTGQQIDELSTQELKLTGVDDEVVKLGAAKLLTFRNVADQVGAGNDVFTRATKAGLDLAQVGFGTPESAAILLGKALNDPIAGMTALTRAGVTFSSSQKATISSLVESGDLLGAQKIILDEVEHQVGGAAEAYGKTLPGQVQIAQESLKNAEATIVGGAAPAMQLLATITTAAAEAIESLPGPLRDIAVVGIAAGVGVGAIARPLSGLVDIWATLSAKRAAATGVTLAEAGAEGVLAGAVSETAASSIAAVAAEEALVAATAELTAAQGAQVAAMRGVDAATVQRVVSNEALAFSDEEVAIAQAQRLVTNAPLIAAEEALAAAEVQATLAAQTEFGALWATTAAAEANTVAAAESAAAWSAFAAGQGAAGASTLSRVGTSALGAAGSVATFATGAAIAVGAAYGLAKGLIWVDEQASEMPGLLAAADQGLQQIVTHAAQFGAQSFKTDLDDLVIKNKDFAEALQHAGKTTGDLVTALIGGRATFGRFNADLAANTNLTNTDREAIGALVQKAQELAGAALTVQVTTGHLSQAMLDATSSQHLFSSGAVDTVAVLADLVQHGVISKEVMNGVVAAAEQQIDTEQQQALANWYGTIAANADKAAAAALQLAPADIRVRRGALNIEDNQRDVDLAEAKVNWLKAAKAPTDEIAAAENDLAAKRLDLEQATLDQAEAETELAVQRYAAVGGQVTQIDQNKIYLGSLGELTGSYKGPVHDALAGYLWDTTRATDAQIALLAAQNAARDAAEQASHKTEFSGGGRFGSGGGVRVMQHGGEVAPGEVFYRSPGEPFEVLLGSGAFRAPSSGGRVLTHEESKTFVVQAAAALAPAPPVAPAAQALPSLDAEAPAAQGPTRFEVVASQLAAQVHLHPEMLGAAQAAVGTMAAHGRVTPDQATQLTIRLAAAAGSGSVQPAAGGDLAQMTLTPAPVSITAATPPEAGTAPLAPVTRAASAPVATAPLPSGGESPAPQVSVLTQQPVVPAAVSITTLAGREQPSAVEPSPLVAPMARQTGVSVPSFGEVTVTPGEAVPAVVSLAVAGGAPVTTDVRTSLTPGATNVSVLGQSPAVSIPAAQFGGFFGQGERVRAAEDGFEVFVREGVYETPFAGQLLPHEPSVAFLDEMSRGVDAAASPTVISTTSRSEGGSIDNSITATIERIETPNPRMSGVVLGRHLRGLRHRMGKR